MNDVQQRHDQATRCAEAGDFHQALSLFAGLVELEPENPERHNDLAAVLFSLGRLPEARASLQRALQLDPACAQALWNLAEVLLAAKDLDAAADLFDRMETAGLLSADLLNRAAQIAMDRDDRPAALDLLVRSFNLAGEQPGVRDMIDVLKLGRVAFFCDFGDTKFVTDIVKHLSARYHVRVSSGRSKQAMLELMQWSDVSWFEWCGPMLVAASRFPANARIVCRLHRWEAYQAWPGEVVWENVDALVTLGNEHVMEALRARAGDIERRTRVVVIPNGVNLDDFPFVDRPRGKNLACLGYLKLHKNPMFMLQCLKHLMSIDDGYRLFFGGSFENEELEQYMRHIVGRMGLADAVSFDGWQEDARAWLSDKHFIVSASIAEGHPVGVMEGMAAGLKPVIHHFPSADAFFPDEFLFRDVEEFVRRVHREDYDPPRYRRFIEERYPLEKQLRAVSDLLDELRAGDLSGSPLPRAPEAARTKVAR